MNPVIKPHHWITIGFAILFGLAGYFALPVFTPIFRETALAFPVFAIALALDTLAGAAGRQRGLLKVLGWLCLILASGVAVWPLRSALETMSTTYMDWSAAGWPWYRAAQEAVHLLGQYSEAQQTCIWIALGVGAVCLGLAIGLPVAGMRSPHIQNDRRSATGPWQAGWMVPSDIKRLKRNKIGLPLALHDGHLLRYAKDDKSGWRGGHHLVVSGTRGGKGVSAVIPAILDHAGPVVALDIKGENFAVTRRHRRSLGRKVAVLNPFGLIERSAHQFNPLSYIRPEELSRDIDLVADGLVRPEQGDGAHFSEMARTLIAAAIEVVVTQEEPERRNLVVVADMLLEARFDTTLQAWVDNADLAGRRAAQAAATILRAGDRERGSIQTSVAKAFSWMQSDAMRHFLQRSSFRMDDLLDDKLDLFIVVPLDQVDRQAIFMRLFINLVLGTVVRQDGRRKVKAPILLALDEFVRMGRMDQIMNIANVAAGAGVEALFVTQDTGQVETAYGRNDARSIFGSCITKRLFNLNDIETAEWAARHLGDNTVYSQQIRESKITSEGCDFSYSEQHQKLMTAEKIMGLKADDMLLLVGNRNPLMAKQNLYFKSKAYHGWFDKNPLS